MVVGGGVLGLPARRRDVRAARRDRDGRSIRAASAAGREYVSKAEALTRFRREFAELAELTTGFDDNPFPASIEVRVRPGAEHDGRAKRWSSGWWRCRAWPTRDTTATGWPGSLSGLGTIRAAGLALALLMAVAAAVTVATVVRLGLRDATGRTRNHGARRGARGLYSRALRGRRLPSGRHRGTLATAALWVGFLIAMAWWGTDLNSLLDGGSVQFLPIRLCFYLILGGMLVGSAGGLVAAREAA